MQAALHNTQNDAVGSSYTFLTSGRTATVARRKRDRAEDLARGARAREIRELLGLSQWDIVEALNKTAKGLGLPAVYRYYTVSRVESGSISFEDARVYIALDPQKRGWEWFVTGHQPAQHANPALFKKAATGRRK